MKSDINKTLASLPKWEKDKPQVGSTVKDDALAGCCLWCQNLAQITASEREEVLNITKKIQLWLSDKLDAQEKIPSHEAPAFTVKELKVKQTPMKALVSRLTK